MLCSYFPHPAERRKLQAKASMTGAHTPALLTNGDLSPADLQEDSEGEDKDGRGQPWNWREDEK